MHLRTVAFLTALSLAPAANVAGQSKPEFTWIDPVGFYRLAAVNPAEFDAFDGDVRIRIFPFEHSQVDLSEHVQRSASLDPAGRLAQFLANYLPRADRDMQLLAQPSVMPLCGFNIYPSGGGPPCRSIGEGADQIWVVRFIDAVNGGRRERIRFVIHKNAHAAVVDVVWGNQAAYARLSPNIAQFLTSLKVVASERPASDVQVPNGSLAQASASRLIPGMYMSTYQRFRPNVLGAPGSGSWFLDSMFLIFSSDGRVYRAFEIPTAPNGDIRRFDYEGARHRDAANSGTYAVAADQVTIRLGTSEVVVGTFLPGSGSIEVYGKQFKYVAMK